jgi:inorganic triphosphatase YgiF
VVTNARPGREIELKLEVAAAELPRLLRSPRLVELAEGRPRRQTLWSVYYDTADLALWRSGLVLRVRAAGRRRIVGVKTRGVVRGGLVAREEVEGPLAGQAGDPRRASPGALLASITEPRLGRAVERAAAGARLVPRVTTQFRRSTLHLRLGTALVELALDEGEAHAGRSRLPIHELELELLEGPTRALFDLALRLAADHELRPAPLGKAERGFARLLGNEAAPVRAEAITLPRNASLDTTLRAVLGECSRHLTANQLAAERGADPEGVHQMRVGARRLRSALRLFDEWLPPRVARSLSDELRWLARELGQARDLDVFLDETLGPILAGRPEDAGLAALREAALATRSDAYGAVRAALRSQRYALLVLRLGRFVEGIPLRRPGAPPLQGRAQPELRRLLEHLAGRVRNLGKRLEQLSAQDLHRLRIRTKRLRYASDLLGPLFGGKEPARTARRLAELQDALGHLNDLVNAEALITQLRERIGATASLATTRAEGFVLGYAARSAAAGRAELAQAWQRVSRLDPFWKARS